MCQNLYRFNLGKVANGGIYKLKSPFFYNPSFSYGIISAIAVAVKALRIVGRLDYGVGGDESAKLRVVVSCAVEVQACGV